MKNRAQQITIIDFIKKYKDLLNIAAIEQKINMPKNTIHLYINKGFEINKRKKDIIEIFSEFFQDFIKIEGVKKQITKNVELHEDRHGYYLFDNQGLKKRKYILKK